MQWPMDVDFVKYLSGKSSKLLKVKHHDIHHLNDIDNNKSLLSIQSYVKQKGTNEIYILDESLPKWIEASRSMHIEVANLLSMLKYE